METSLRSWRTWRRLGRTALQVLAIAACSPGGEGPVATVAGPLEALPVVTVTIGTLELDVAVADSEAERAAGLAGVDDLGPLDGLLFAFPAEVETRFTMRGTLIPLDVAFISSDGLVTDVQAMAVCEGDPCPPHAAPGPYRWALETPAGGLSDVRRGDAFSIEP